MWYVGRVGRGWGEWMWVGGRWGGEGWKRVGVVREGWVGGKNGSPDLYAP